MANKPETTDRFRIFAETSSEAMGPLLAQLTRMGLENIGYELITDIRRFNRNERKAHEAGLVEFATLWVKDHPTFKASELARHFAEHDRPRSSSYSALRDLVKNGSIIKLSPGFYKRADVKAIAPPKGGPAPKRGQVGRYKTTNDSLILRELRKRKHVTVLQMRAMLDAEGRNGKSASPIISRFAKAGLLKQTEPGAYDVIKGKLRTPALAKATSVHKKADRLRAQANRDRAKAEKLNGQQPGGDANG